MFLIVSNLEKICIHMEFAQYLHNFAYKARCIPKFLLAWLSKFLNTDCILFTITKQLCKNLLAWPTFTCPRPLGNVTCQALVFHCYLFVFICCAMSCKKFLSVIIVVNCMRSALFLELGKTGWYPIDTKISPMHHEWRYVSLLQWNLLIYKNNLFQGLFCVCTQPMRGNVTM